MSLRQALATFESALNNPHWLVAYSAGADSVLLLDLAVEAAHSRPQTQVTAYYLHHYSGAIEPERQRAISCSFSRAKEKLGERFEFCERRRDITALAQRLHRSWEYTASLVRRKELKRLSARLGMAQVFTGHQLSDYAETLQLRAGRRIPQSAWPLLSVHDPVTGFLRPLAYCTREQVRTLAQDRGLIWYDDPSNNDMAIARNKLRAAQAQPAWENLPAMTAALKTPQLEQVHPRELRLSAAEWLSLTPQQRARIVYRAWQRLGIVKKFTRNHFARAARLPFSLPPFFAHTEVTGKIEYIVFRRGLGSMALRAPATERGVRGDAVTRSFTLRQPYGHKSVTKIFSERRLSPRQRRLTWLETGEHAREVLRIFFPDGAVL